MTNQRRTRPTESPLTVTRQMIAACPGCNDYVAANPGLAGACASVGIEHGHSTGWMMFHHLAAYHFRGHQSDAGAVPVGDRGQQT